MSAALDYAQFHEDAIEPRDNEIEVAVKMLRDGGHYQRVSNDAVIDEMADHPEYQEAVWHCATVNPVSPEGKRAMDRMSDIFDWAATRLVERELGIERQEKHLKAA